MSLNAYQRTRNIIETPRQAERRLMCEITGDMIQARDAGHERGALMPPLHRNRELWSTFSAVCGNAGNELPDGLRAGIISLALWVDQFTSDVVAGRESIDDLIAVNRDVIDGLSGTGVPCQCLVADDRPVAETPFRLERGPDVGEQRTRGLEPMHRRQRIELRQGRPAGPLAEQRQQGIGQERFFERSQHVQPGRLGALDRSANDTLVLPARNDQVGGGRARGERGDDLEAVCPRKFEVEHHNVEPVAAFGDAVFERVRPRDLMPVERYRSRWQAVRARFPQAPPFALPHSETLPRSEAMSRSEALQRMGLPDQRTIIAVPLEYEHEENFFPLQHGFARNVDLVAHLAANLADDVVLALTNHPLNRMFGNDAALRAMVDAYGPRLRLVELAENDGASTNLLANHCDGMIVQNSKSFAAGAFFGKPMLRLSRRRTADWLHMYTDLDAFIAAIRNRTAATPDPDMARRWFAWRVIGEAFSAKAIGAPELIDRLHGTRSIESGSAALTRYDQHQPGSPKNA